MLHSVFRKSPWGLALLVLVSGLLSASGYAVGAPRIKGLQCSRYVSRQLGREVGYCVHRSRPELPVLASEPVLYFFHGSGGSASSWRDNGYAEALDILTKEEFFPRFTVVSFDTAATSFFSDLGGRPTGPDSYETWFTREFMPYVEAKHGLCSKRECRATAGLSMGGLGAIKTAIRHPDLFFAAAANAAAIAPFSAYEPFTSWMAYFGRHPIGPLQGQVLLSQVRRVFPTPQLFDEHDPPVLVARFADLSQFPRLYFDVGGQDYFGFQEGFYRLREALDARSIGYQWHYNPNGTHDDFWDRRWWLIRWVRDQFSEAQKDRRQHTGQK